VSATAPAAPATRTVLFTGKGGVGKTTLAAATAVAAAAGGSRTLVLSTDPAHSLSDVLGVALTGEPASVGGDTHPLLQAAEVDVRGRFEAAWSQVRQYLVGVLAARGVADVTAEELVVLPGADEVLALLELEQRAASGAFDVIVVDCAPTGETLRLLALPETLAFYAERLFTAPQRLLRALAAGLGRGGASAPDGEVRDAVSELLSRLTAARTLLTAPTSGVTVVTTAEQVVLAEARRAYTALSLHGYRVSGVVVNRLLPEEADGDWAARIRTGQQRQLTAVAESFAGLPVFSAPLRATEPVGVAALAELAAEVYGDRNPIPGPDGAGPGLVVGGGQGRWTLTVALPLADRGQVTLTRAGDDLVITVGSHRRRVALPSLLQRCTATGATFADDALVVAFEPDPARWPDALVGV
jgi:arsenite-transporting ATPase